MTANALTTGDAVDINHTTTAITTGALLRVSSTSADAFTTGALAHISSSGNFTSTANTAGLLNVSASATAAGTLTNIANSFGSQTTSTLLNVIQSGTTTGYTGNVVNFTGSSTTGASNLLNLTSVNTTAGNALNVTANSLTTGNAVNINSTATGVTTGSLLRISTGTTGAVATNGIVSLNATGNYTSTSNAGLLNVAANSTTAGTVVNIQGTSLTTGTAVNINAGSGIGLTVSSTTDITTGTNEDLTVVANGTGQIILNDTVQVATLGTASNDTVVCRNGTNQLAACNSTFATTTQLQGYVQFTPASAQADASANASIYINDTAGGNLLHLQSGAADKFVVDNSGNTTVGGNLTFAQGANRTLGVATTASGAGNSLTIAGGNSQASGNVNGGNVILTGGTGNGTGTSGSVIVKSNVTNSTTAFQVQNAASTDVLTVDTVNSRLSVRSLASEAVLGSELNVNPDFSTDWDGSPDWDLSGGTTAIHNSGNTTPLSPSTPISVTAGAVYQVEFCVSGRTAGSVTPSIGAALGTAVGSDSCTETHLLTASNTNDLIFTPTSDFDGTIDSVSVKLVTASSAVIRVLNTNGSTGVEIRSGGSDLHNTFIGLNSGSSNTTGSQNSAVGSGALQNNTTGSQNSAVGSGALQNNTTGSNNSAVGLTALYSNTTGSQNSAFGQAALLYNTTGSQNSAFGQAALANNTTGSLNTAVGNSALQNNTTGAQNIGVGYAALQSNTTGFENTALGINALLSNTTGGDNTALGFWSMISNTTGSNNTALGFYSGFADPYTSSFVTLNNLNNTTALGSGAQVQQSNALILGGQDANAVNVGIGTTMPTNLLSVSPVSYSTGTAGTGGVSDTTVTGVGTTWDSTMIGSEIIFANGNAATTPQKATITAVGSTTSMTVSPAVTVANGTAYRIHRPVLQVTTAGNVGIGDTTPAGLLTVGNGDLFQINSSGDITTAAGENLSINTGTTGTITIDSGTTGDISIGNNANAKTITLGNTQAGTIATFNAGAYNLNIRNTGIGINAATPTTGSVDLFFGSGARTININQSAASTAGGNLTIAAGMSGTGAVNGGNLVLQGGASGGSGAQGLVTLSTTSFTAAGVQTFASAGTFPITAGNIDLYSTLPVTASIAGVIVTIPDPAQSVIGRIVYIAARSGSNDFTLRLNSTRTPIDIAMKANSTATLIWNGTDWTAAGASSSTDLQSAYNNTLTSAGGAELVLNAAGGAADGLTIRNNATTPISGGILEVQSSIGTNLFSVNNFGTELAVNGGSETSASFNTDWTVVGSASRSRTTTAGQFVTGLAGASVTTTAAANDGVRNNLSANPVVSTTYQVSFAAKLAAGTFTTLDVRYSRDGGTDLEPCTSYSTQTLSTSVWTKITCTITTDGTTATNPDLIIRQTDATARTFYIDNLSFMRNDSTTQPSNVQIGGGINGGPVTLFTLDRSTAPPVANGDTTYYGSMYYDTTTGSIQCYEADGWGACGSPPDNIITLTPEYTGAVLNGTGVGTLTADFCSNSVALTVGTLCDSGDARNYYRWTSPQATAQDYSIYVTYKLPSTFKQFNSASTMKLTTRSTNTSFATADLQVLRKAAAGGITSCGAHTDLNSSANTWQQVTYSGDETACGFTGGDYIIFKITVTAEDSESIYIENLDFTYTNR